MSDLQRLRNKRIAFVTSKAYRQLTESDRLASEGLQAEGALIVPAIWDDPSIDWNVFDAIVVRSPWDYHQHAGRFLAWIDSIDTRVVWNPPAILRWNMDKHYLLDLERKGVPIPRTVFPEKGSPFDVSAVGSHLGVDEVVVKPVVSASAWNTWRCSLGRFSADDGRRLDVLMSTTGIVVQEFMPEITTDGEWSLMFFGDRFSHAVRKYPAEGDFRVQDEHGGYSVAEPNLSDDVIRQARNVLAAAEGPLLYARVDGVVRRGLFILMELELIEPALFFDLDPTGVGRFVERLAELLDVE